VVGQFPQSYVFSVPLWFNDSSHGFGWVLPHFDASVSVASQTRSSFARPACSPMTERRSPGSLTTLNSSGRQRMSPEDLRAEARKLGIYPPAAADPYAPPTGPLPGTNGTASSPWQR
jgi:hypothetical protein